MRDFRQNPSAYRILHVRRTRITLGAQAQSDYASTGQPCRWAHRPKSAKQWRRLSKAFNLKHTHKPPLKPLPRGNPTGMERRNYPAHRATPAPTVTSLLPKQSGPRSPAPAHQTCIRPEPSPRRKKKILEPNYCLSKPPPRFPSQFVPSRLRELGRSRTANVRSTPGAFVHPTSCQSDGDLTKRDPGEPGQTSGSGLQGPLVKTDGGRSLPPPRTRPPAALAASKCRSASFIAHCPAVRAPKNSPRKAMPPPKEPGPHKTLCPPACAPKRCSRSSQQWPPRAPKCLG